MILCYKGGLPEEKRAMESINDEKHVYYTNINSMIVEARCSLWMMTSMLVNGSHRGS